ncbi:MAG: hypothetical protein RDV41_05890 [Planctomycetota bacterium]|nr:hypothetical protein [Planctomycetota bacterium]
MTEGWLLGGKPDEQIPERRKPRPQQPAVETNAEPAGGEIVWRCVVCGYLCARKEPPAVCPICKAKKDRFEEFGKILVTEKKPDPPKAT